MQSAEIMELTPLHHSRRIIAMRKTARIALSLENRNPPAGLNGGRLTLATAC
jgi:hypothetical protein